jgi:hypothetical protein
MSIPSYLPITSGTDLIGTTLCIAHNSGFQNISKRIFDFNNSNNGTSEATAYIFGPLGSATNKFSLSFKDSTGTIQTTDSAYTTNGNVFIYTIYFISTTQIEYNIYSWINNTTVTLQSTITITIPSTLLQSINTFWFARPSTSGIPYNNGYYEKICLFMGNITNPNATLSGLITSIANNTFTATRYAFGPINVINLKGIVVQIDGNVDSNNSEIFTAANGTISGGYLTMLGSFYAVPIRPTNVIATQTTVITFNDSMIINWTPSKSNGGSVILEHIVTSYIDSVSTGNTRSTSGSATTLTFSGLAPGNYTFGVVAINAIGVSPSSPLSFPGKLIASEGGPVYNQPSAPTNVGAVAGNGEATINWTAPSDGGSPITSYTVTSSPGGLTATTTNGTTTTATIQGLTNNTAYTFTVKATNIAGSSVSSAPTTSVTPMVSITIPNPPTSVTGTLVDNNLSMMINWTPPTNNGGSEILEYIVKAYLEGVDTSLTRSASGSATTLTFSGLYAGEYSFRVFARNIIGLSVLSNETSAEFIENFEGPVYNQPSAPTNVSAVAGNGEATINWTAPSDGGSPITSYTVTSSPGGLTTTTANGTTTIATIQGLSNGTAYTFTVKATNVTGDSAASAPTTPVTPTSSTTPVTPPSSSNLIFNFYLPGSFGISQDTELYIMDELSQGSREFHWKINCGYTLNELFLNRTYKQLSTNEEAIETNLSINNIYVNGLFNNVLNGVGGLNGNFNGLSTSTTSFSQRLLEMAALKIFAHAKAKAAIGNDSDFVDLQTRVITHLYDSFSNVNIKQQFFESYIKSQETINANGANDVDEYQNFNLTNSQIFIYGIFSGNILDATPTTVGTLPINTYTANMRIELCGFY